VPSKKSGWEKRGIAKEEKNKNNLLDEKGEREGCLMGGGNRHFEGKLGKEVGGRPWGKLVGASAWPLDIGGGGGGIQTLSWGTKKKEDVCKKKRKKKICPALPTKKTKDLVKVLSPRIKKANVKNKTVAMRGRSSRSSNAPGVLERHRIWSENQK